MKRVSSGANSIARAVHEVGYGAGLRGARRSNVSGGCNGGHAHGYEFGSKARQGSIISPGPSFGDANISALDEAGLRQALPK